MTNNNDETDYPTPPPNPLFVTEGGRNPSAPTCPGCGKANDGYTGISHTELNMRPDEGSVSICAYCGTVSIFLADWSLRRPTGEELKDIMRDPLIRKLIRQMPVMLNRNRDK
jgi:hypothetical protein